MLENTCAGVLFNKDDALNACNIIRKTLWHRRFSISQFCENLRRAFLESTSWWPFLAWCCFFLYADQWGLHPKSNLFGGNNATLGKGIHKFFQCCVVMEIRGNFTYLMVVTTHSEKKRWSVTCTFIICKDY